MMLCTFHVLKRGLLNYLELYLLYIWISVFLGKAVYEIFPNDQSLLQTKWLAQGHVSCLGQSQGCSEPCAFPIVPGRKSVTY